MKVNKGKIYNLLIWSFIAVSLIVLLCTFPNMVKAQNYSHVGDKTNSELVSFVNVSNIVIIESEQFQLLETVDASGLLVFHLISKMDSLVDFTFSQTYYNNTGDSIKVEKTEPTNIYYDSDYYETTFLVYQDVNFIELSFNDQYYKFDRELIKYYSFNAFRFGKYILFEPTTHRTKGNKTYLEFVNQERIDKELKQLQSN